MRQRTIDVVQQAIQRVPDVPRGPPSWNVGYKSIRSHNVAVRWVQNALSFIGFVLPTRGEPPR